MTDIIASTRAAFFEHYNHPFDPNETAYNEFLSLATSRNWKQGSKKDAFGNAWRLCFGPGIPVGIEPETYDMNGRAFDYTGDELAEQLQNLNLRATKPTRHEVQHGQVAGLFTHYYGSDVSRLEKWQMLCSDCGVAPIPTSITQCKKVSTSPRTPIQPSLRQHPTIPSASPSRGLR